MYVALAEQLGTAVVADDHRLVGAPTVPRTVPVVQLPLR